MYIRTFPADGYMTVYSTPAELRDLANRLEKGDVNVQPSVPEGHIVVGVMLDEDVARTQR